MDRSACVNHGGFSWDVCEYTMVDSVVFGLLQGNQSSSAQFVSVCRGLNVKLPYLCSVGGEYWRN